MAAAVALLPIGGDHHDMVEYFKPWMAVAQERGLASLSSDFADYTPPYIYLLYAASWLVPLVGLVAAIKLINLPFIALLSVAIYQRSFSRQEAGKLPQPPAQPRASLRRCS